MVKMLTAHTSEIDEVEQAVEEILGQLDLEGNLLKNAFGILSCYAEFIETGVVKALCERLPFDVIGGTTLGSGVPGENGLMLLSLSVLTSDDVQFACVQTEPVAGDLAVVKAAYDQASGALPEAAKLVIAFLPMETRFGGETIMRALDSASGAVPIFGTVVADHESDFSTTFTIFNGEASHDTAVMALITGNVSPRFLLHSIPDRKLQNQRAVITQSEYSILKEVNDMPVLEYLRSIGLWHGGGLEGMSAIPFLVDYNDGRPAVARALYTVLEDQSILCGATMQQGATLAIGSIDADSVMETAQQAVDAIKAVEDGQCVLMLPCLSRLSVLGADPTQEMALIDGQLSDLPYHLLYSGGEICPLTSAEGEYANHFHNFTIIACVL